MGKKALGNVETARKDGDEDFVVADAPVSVRAATIRENPPHSSPPAGSGRSMRLVTFHLTEPMITGIERLIHAGKYLSRSDAVRAAIRKLLDDEWPRWCGA